MNKEILKFSRKFISISKITIMLPVALTSVTGYFLYSPSFSANLFILVAGILFLAIAASVLNQIEERKLDALMNRTRHRPLANNSVSLFSAWILFSAFFSAGSLILLRIGGFNTFLIGIFTLAWYNVVYTYLKRITAFAIVPGALTGALPPLIGYVGAGGSMDYHGIYALCFVLFVAQIPHFWMIQIRYGQEYTLAGFPSLTTYFNPDSLERLTFIWVSASIACAMLLPLFGLITKGLLITFLVVISFIIFFLFLNRIVKWFTLKEESYFGAFNMYYLIVMVLIVVQNI